MRARRERDQYRKKLTVSDTILKRLDSNLQGISEQETQHIVAACALHWRRKTMAAKLERANKQLEILKDTTQSVHNELRELQNEGQVVLNIHISEDLPMPILQVDRSVQTTLPVPLPVPQAGDASGIPHSLVLGALTVAKLFAKIPLTQGNVKAALTGGYVTYELVGANLLNVPIKPFYRPAAWIGKSVGKKIGTTVKPKSTVPANCRPNEDKGTHGSVIGMSPTPIVPPVPTEL